MPFVAALIAIAINFLAVDVGLGVALATGIVNGLIGIGLSFIANALFGPKEPSVHGRRENIRNPIAPRRFYYGRVKPGGVMTFLKIASLSFATEGKVNALHYVISIAGREFDHFEFHWFGDAQIVMDSSNIVIVPEHYYWGSLPYAKLTWHEGTDTQDPDSMLLADFPNSWTSAFHGYGIPYAVLRLFSPELKDFTNVYPEGLPVYSTIARAAKIWDSRDGTQSNTDKTTWKWKSNGILATLDYLWSGDGSRLPLEMILPAIDVWNMEADYCETWRDTLNGGSELWYRLAGGYQSNEPPKVVLPRMLDPMDAKLFLRADGAIAISVGRWRDPELTIPNSQIYSYSGFGRGKQKGDVKNVIDATFISPDYNFVQQQADPLRNETSIAIDTEQVMTLDLDWAPSHPQARTRMKIEAYRQDPQNWSGKIVTKAYGLKYLTPNADGSPKRFICFEIDDLEIDSTIAFEVLGFAFDARAGRCTFTVSQMSADAYNYDPASDEGTPPLLVRGTGGVGGVEDPYNFAITVSGDVITATFAVPIDTGLSYSLQVRVTADAVGDDTASWTELTHSSGWGGHTGSLADGRYDVRVRLWYHDKQNLYSNPRVIRGIKIGTGAPAGVPSAPVSFAATNRGGNTVELVLTAVTDMRAVGVKIWKGTGFGSIFASAVLEVQYDLTSGSALDVFHLAAATGAFNFWATTTDVFGNDSLTPIGPAAVTITGGAFSPPNPVPSIPADAASVTVRATSADFTWTANPGGDAVTAYQLWGAEIETDASGVGLDQTTLLGTFGSSATSATIKGLSPDTTYCFYLVAVNANGPSVEAPVQRFTTTELNGYRLVTASSSPITLEDDDQWVGVNNTTSAALEIRMMANPTSDRTVIISDAGNNAGSHDLILKDTAGTNTLDTISFNGVSSRVGWTGTLWFLGGGIQ